MPDIKLVAEPGRVSGSNKSRQLRAAGRIPAVVYGHGIEPISISVDARELRHALGGEAGSRALLSLQIGNEEHLAMARQLQRHPVRHTVTHVDFQVVGRDEVISAAIPVVLTGEAVAVDHAGGRVELESQSLMVKAPPAQLPTQLVVDISDMDIGDMIHAADLKLPPGVELDTDPETLVAAAHVGRAAEEAEAVEAEAAATEEASAESDVS